ncbi:hypothetical protein ACIP9C_15825 [Lysinibacillus sp. NPDC093210]|uniref:hypothetical protein n=1 Tax=Lysinibacillus sp. NPDC093210 TaxID=3364133 RepID=UPI00380C3A4B
MQGFIRYCSIVILILLLSGCAGVEKDKTSLNAKLTIESYNMSEKESLLISKTGVENIKFFKLNGILPEEDDLQFSVEVYKKGKLKEELLKSWGAIEKNYQDSFISFGVSDSNRPLKLLSGIPSGIASKTYSSGMTSSSFSNLISENVTLTKNKPVYLVAWLGTTKNELRSVRSKNGELPAGIEEAELAFLYKVLWTDKDKNLH